MWGDRSQEEHAEVSHEEVLSREKWSVVTRGDKNEESTHLN